MAEETPKQYPATKTDDFEKIQEWLYLCLSRWYWFALSLAVAFGLLLVQRRRDGAAGYQRPRAAGLPYLSGR